MPAVTFVIHSPSPYHVELFDALAARPGVQITVIYVHAHEHGRQWTGPRFAHRALFLKDADSTKKAVLECDLLVMGFHEHPASRQWMRLRLASGKKWAFWGENPGALLRGVLGRWLRRWRLRWLRASTAPVWAIGTRAVDAYRAEVGGAREVLNLPYFSNLARFRPANAVDEDRAGVRFLFVGGLTMRKGADLLMQAFTAVQPGTPHTLAFTGDGPLRQRLHYAAPAGCRFTGFADWSALPAAYAGHDCLVVPSRYDGWGMVVPEGLAAGLPVISTDQMGSALDLITPDVNGWRARAASFESLRAAMERAADQIPRDRAGWRQRALDAVSGHQLENGVCHFERAIQSALGGATR